MAFSRPQTISQAVAHLQALLPAEVLEEIRRQPFDDLVELHFAEGALIREKLDLWDPHHPLTHTGDHPHPDDLSLIILEALWRKLNEVG